MADHITNGLLRNLANYAWPAYCTDRDIQSIAAELLTARAEIERLREDANATAMDLVDERDDARAEVERLRNHIDSAGTGFNVALGAIRLSLEQADKDRDALRDDLREAMELLRAHGMPPNWLKLGDAADWNRRYGALLAKHKETNQ